MTEDIRIGTSVTYEHGLIKVEGVVVEVYGDHAVVRTLSTGDTVSQPLDALCRWEAPFPPFQAGYGRPDLDRLYQVAYALRRGDNPLEVLHNVENYLTHRGPDDITG